MAKTIEIKGKIDPSIFAELAKIKEEAKEVGLGVDALHAKINQKASVSISTSGLNKLKKEIKETTSNISVLHKVAKEPVTISFNISGQVTRELDKIAVQARKASEVMRELRAAIGDKKSLSLNVEAKNRIDKSIIATIDKIKQAGKEAAQAVKEMQIALTQGGKINIDKSIINAKASLAGLKVEHQQLINLEKREKLELAQINKESATALQLAREIKLETLAKNAGKNELLRQQKLQASIDKDLALAQQRMIKASATQSKALAKVAREAAKQRTIFDQLKTSYIGVAKVFASTYVIGVTVGSLTKLGDTTTVLSNKLAVLGYDTERAKEELHSLNNIANNSYSDIETTATLYVRLHRAISQMGGTSQEAKIATETLSKAVKLAGLTSGEASSALLQLSQAFNKGKLDGDEFRSVMENFPIFADKIAQSLGVTTGQLFRFSKEGKITADVMRKAMGLLADDVNEKFSKMTPTVEQAFTVFKNNATLAFSEMYKATGASTALADTLIYLSDNTDKVAKALTAAGVAITLVFGQKLAGTLKKTAGALKSLGSKTLLARLGWIGLSLAVLDFIADLTGVKQKFEDFFASLNKTNIELTSYRNNIQDFASDILKGTASIDKIGDTIKKNTASIEPLLSKLDELHKKTQPRYINELGEASGNMGIALPAEINRAQFDEQAAPIVKQLANNYEIAQIAVDSLTKSLSTYQAQLASGGDNQKVLNDLINKTRQQIDDTRSSMDDIRNTLERLNIPLSEVNKGFLQQSINMAEAEKRAKSLNDALDKVKSVGGEAKERIRLRELQQTNPSQYYREKAEEDVKRKVGSANIDILKSTKEGREELETVTKLVQKEMELGQVRKANNIVEVERKSGFDKANDSYKKYLNDLKTEAELLKISKDAYKDYGALYRNIYKWKQQGKELSAKEQQELAKLIELQKSNVKLTDSQSSRLKELQTIKQQGFTLSEREITQLKQQIDLNRKLNEIASYKKDFDENSFTKRNEHWQNKLEAYKQFINSSETNDADKAQATQGLLTEIGGDGIFGRNYFEVLVTQAEDAFARLDELYNTNAISFGEKMTAGVGVGLIAFKNVEQVVGTTLDNIALLQNSRNKKLATIGKAAAIAQATMATAGAAIEAYKSAAAIPYVGYVLAPAAAAGAIALGMAQVAQIKAQPTGYKEGGFVGFTGYRDPNAVAGEVHGSEYVMDRKTTRDLGVNNLEALRRGSAYIQHNKEKIEKAKQPNISIQNYGTNKTFETKTLSSGDVQIICNDVIENSVGNYILDGLKYDNEIIERIKVISKD